MPQLAVPVNRVQGWAIFTKCQLLKIIFYYYVIKCTCIHVRCGFLWFEKPVYLEFLSDSDCVNCCETITKILNQRKT